jgi:hypothetical protein
MVKSTNTVKKLNDYFGVLRPNFSVNEFWCSPTRNLCIISQYEMIGDTLFYIREPIGEFKQFFFKDAHC